jgi:hypothetical protein
LFPPAKKAGAAATLPGVSFSFGLWKKAGWKHISLSPKNIKTMYFCASVNFLKVRAAALTPTAVFMRGCSPEKMRLRVTALQAMSGILLFLIASEPPGKNFLFGQISLPLSA